jgi:molecular chaperone DnaK (HSP70)
MAPQYAIGIDLGTTNSLLAYIRLDAGLEAQPKCLSIEQSVATFQTEGLHQLPSFQYMPEATCPDGMYALPWDPRPAVVVGRLARELAATLPDRVAMASKSWLCFGQIDRRSPVLPLHAADDVRRLSPVDCARITLAHLAAAWQARFPEHPLGEQSVALCVPASFDPVARELTRTAAIDAGLPADAILLEEPTAAVYRWVAARGDRWREELACDDQLLVVDVGGGTTDLTLIGVTELEGVLTLDRRAVGNHLLVGGDNMDLALAHHVASAFESRGQTLDPWQSIGLWHACRNAKEQLLSGQSTGHATVALLGRGSRLIGGSLSHDLTVEQVEHVVVDGFFPRCAVTDRPARAVSSGFQELGLPYESDPAITRHLAQFVGEHAASGSVTHVLLNGGVFKSPRLQQRLLEVLAAWLPRTPQLLSGSADLDDAVALGAAYYAWSSARGGIRIRGGLSHSYYLGVEAAGMAIPGAPRPLRALCVAPHGMEEGTSEDVPGAQIGLVVGQPARFRFFASANRPQDAIGQRIDRWQPDELIESAPLELTLDGAGAGESGPDSIVPVRLHTKITELGMFELYCRSLRDDRQWKLEFNIRQPPVGQRLAP